MKRQVRHCFQSFLDPTKCDSQEEDCWTESIAGFDLAVGHLDTLCGWIVGRAALHMETLTEEQVQDWRRVEKIGRTDQGAKEVINLRSGGSRLLGSSSKVSWSRCSRSTRVQVRIVDLAIEKSADA